MKPQESICSARVQYVRVVVQATIPGLMSGDVVLVHYEIRAAGAALGGAGAPAGAAPGGAGAGAGPLAGSFYLRAAGARPTLRDVEAAWPFEGAFHFRAALEPPGEAHVYLDLLPGAGAPPVPLQADGSLRLVALALGGAPRAPRAEAWAWSAEEFAAWGAARAAAAAARAAAAPQTPPPAAAAGAPDADAADGDLWPGAADEGARGWGGAVAADAEERVREAAGAAGAAAAAALKSAGAAASRAGAAMSGIFGRAAAAVRERMAN